MAEADIGESMRAFASLTRENAVSMIAAFAGVEVTGIDATKVGETQLIFAESEVK
jgi:hypothetical protein